MAPKRRSGRAVKTVVTTTKVVEETVEVVVGPNGGESEPVEILSSSTKENRDIKITEPVSKTIPVQEKPEQQEEAAIGDDHDEVDDDETQPASQLEAPSPPLEPAAGAQKPVGPSTPREDREKMKKQKVAGKEKPAAAAADGGGEGKKRRRRRGGGPEGYKRYVWKVMKQVHPDMGMSSKAMTVVNNLMVDMFERLAEEAARLQGHAGLKTMSSREIQAAVKLVLPGELGKHAIAEGTKAVTNYVTYVAGGK